jgi:SAM-dependent methyltransferase
MGTFGRSGNLGRVWAMGDYATVGDRFAAASESMVAELVKPHHRLLDVACGQGPVALAAARLGARVTGLDNTPELLAVARARAEAAGLEVGWLQADMTAMPLPDGSFDRVLSAFGAMFAADQRAMAAELVRVCAPQGVVGNLAWCPEGTFAQLRPLLSRYLDGPAGPDIDLWGIADRAVSFFDGLPVQVQTRVETVRVRWDSLDHAVSEVTTKVPGMLMARMAIGPTGRWPEVVKDVRALLAEQGREDEGFLVSVPYLMTLANRR